MAIKMKRLRLKEGDVFTIPIDEKTHGYGQIVKIPNKYGFIIAVFEGKWNNDDGIMLDSLIKSRILFLGYTLDALLYHGTWVIIGNTTANLPSIVMPYFKLGLPSEAPKLANYKLDVIRLATTEEAKLLSFHNIMSPMGYQKELQAYYKVVEWQPDIKYNYTHILNTLKKLNLLDSVSNSH